MLIITGVFSEAVSKYDLDLLKLAVSKCDERKVTELFTNLLTRAAMKFVLQVVDVNVGAVMNRLLVQGDTERIEYLAAIRG